MKISNEILNLALVNSCLSMIELSKLSGVNKVTLTRISKGTQEPMPKTVGRLAKALGISVEELIQN
jgi:transcriptional regulator with XRE-family HTH domain